VRLNWLSLSLTVIQRYHFVMKEHIRLSTLMCIDVSRTKEAFSTMPPLVTWAFFLSRTILNIVESLQQKTGLFQLRPDIMSSSGIGKQYWVKLGSHCKLVRYQILPGSKDPNLNQEIQVMISFTGYYFMHAHPWSRQYIQFADSEYYESFGYGMSLNNLKSRFVCVFSLAVFS
jgi:hypothetical protein